MDKGRKRNRSDSDLREGSDLPKRKRSDSGKGSDTSKKVKDVLRDDVKDKAK